MTCIRDLYTSFSFFHLGFSFIVCINVQIAGYSSYLEITGSFLFLLKHNDHSSLQFEFYGSVVWEMGILCFISSHVGHGLWVNIWIQVSRSSSVPPNTRDNLYQGLPPGVKSALRSKLQSFQVKEEVSIVYLLHGLLTTSQNFYFSTWH